MAHLLRPKLDETLLTEDNDGISVSSFANGTIDSELRHTKFSRSRLAIGEVAGLETHVQRQEASRIMRMSLNGSFGKRTR